jgi:hypothetical protein
VKSGGSSIRLDKSRNSEIREKLEADNTAEEIAANREGLVVRVDRVRENIRLKRAHNYKGTSKTGKGTICNITGSNPISECMKNVNSLG